MPGEIIIVENSGDLHEENILRSAVARLSNVEMVSTGRNLGFAGGVNFALRQMLPLGFNAFLLINNDTVVPDDLIEKLRRGAGTAALDIASPVIYRYPEKDRLWSRGNYYNVWSGLITDNPLPLPGNFFYLPGCCLLVKKSVFEAIGFFNEDFFMYGEDVEFCHRAVTRGFRIGIVPEACLYHKTGAAAGQNSLFYETAVNRGHLLLARKLLHSSGAQGVALSIKLLVLFLRAIVRTGRFSNGNALQGYASALRSFFAQQSATGP